MLYKIIGIIIILASVTIGGYSWYEPDAFGAITAKIPNKNSLAGYWSFDDGSGTQAGDFSGNGNTGTLTNGPTWVDGKIGKALSFDGTDDYVNSLGSVSSYPFVQNTGIFTLSAWIKSSDYTATGQKTILSNTAGTAESGMFYMYENSSGNRQLRLFIGKSVASVPVIDSYSSANVISDNNWHHTVVVGDGTNITFYIDGAANAGSGTMGTKASGDSSRVMNIGRYNYSTPGGYFNGQIDEVRVYNRALSATEIAALYQSGAAKANVSQNSQSTGGLVGQWSFNGPDITDKVYDRSGQGNNGYFIGGATSSAKAVGKVGQALRFDGTDDYVDVGDVSSLRFGTGDFSISAWIYFSGLDTFGCIVCKRHNATPYNQYDLTVTADAYAGGAGKKVVAFIRPDSGLTNNADDRVVTSTDIFAGWHHLVMVEDYDTQLQLFIDGASAGVDTNSHNGKSNDIIGDAFGIGRSNAGNYYNNKIDEVRIYNRALAATEIAALYQSGGAKANVSQNSQSTGGLVGQWSFNGPDITDKVYDRSGQGNNGYFIGGATSSAKVIGKVGQAVTFDGSNDLVDMGDQSSLNATTAFTVAAWVKKTGNSPGVSTSGVIAHKWESSVGWFIDFMDSDDVDARQIRFFISGVSDTSLYSGTTISNNEWHYVTVKYDGSNKYIYIDGAQVASEATTGTPGTQATPFRVGYGITSGATANWFNGQIDEVRMYNRALSASEVSFLYNMGR